MRKLYKVFVQRSLYVYVAAEDATHARTLAEDAAYDEQHRQDTDWDAVDAVECESLPAEDRDANVYIESE